MKIANLKIFNNSYLRKTDLNTNKSSSVPTFKGYTPLQSDRVELSPRDEYQSGLSKINKITKAEYDSLTGFEKLELRYKVNDLYNPNEAIPSEIKDQIAIHQYAAEAIKKSFDAQYGENNYVVIPIGRSLSSIGKKLSLKIGEQNVKNIPMSDMGQFFTDGSMISTYQDKNEQFTEMKCFKDYKKYLASIGLSKEEIEKSDKQYILMDYCSSGESLKGAYIVLTSDELLGNEKKNISYCDVRDALSPIENKKVITRLGEELSHSKYKKYSTLGRTHWDVLPLEQAIDYQKSDKLSREKEKIKLFGFALLDDEFGSDKSDSDIGKLNDNFLTPSEEEIPLQERKVYLSPTDQYKQDVFTGCLSINNLALRLAKKIKKQKDIKTDFQKTNFTEANRLNFWTKNKIEETFPLEYQYFRKQKSFESMQKSLDEETVEKLKPIIYKEAQGFEKQSELYRFLDESENYIKQLMDKAEDYLRKNSDETQTIFDTSEMKQMNADFEKLNKASYEIMSYKKLYTLDEEPYLDRAKVKRDYYEKFRPALMKNIEEISKRFPLSFNEEFSSKINDIAANAKKEENKETTDFKQKITEKLATLNGAKDQKELEAIIEQQKEALNEASKKILPF